jgi:E3 ubiquitin-protein ligase UBR4
MCNEDCVAVCGLKECQVLTFNSSGAVSDHLVLHPSLEGTGAILKPLWIPGSQTELAIITTDFIKIYDLSVDAISPYFYFLLPSGKIRDATFACSEQVRVLIVMSSKGQLYVQPMDQFTSADHGPFYLTLHLKVEHSSLQESEGQIADGGISVHYSHPLQLLFFSYSQGQSFAASMADSHTVVQKLFPLIYKSGGTKNQSGLCQWSDVVNHPGLLVCMTQPAGTPVMLMVKPDQILIQEFKNIPSKSKAQGIISVHHGSSDQQTSQHTTTIVLCEDGSLRIYLASNEKTKFWLSPVFQPTSHLNVVHGTTHKKSVRSTSRSGQVKLPVDFFETLQSQSEIEFGGKDILHVYNSQQVKLRLNTTGMYIASSKQGGFEIKVNNPVATTVMVGVRIQVGCQSLERAPSYLEVFGRQIPVSLTRNRWYDLAFTREEALTADKQFTVKFGASGDPSGITMVDSIKVFVKTKESFGWPDESQEELIGRFPTSATSAVEIPNVSGEVSLKMPTTNTDQIVASCLQTLDGSITQEWKENVQFKETCLTVATQLLMAHTPSVVLTQTKALLATLHPTKQAYHLHKDNAQLSQVVQLLDSSSAQTEPMDVDSFQNLLGGARSVGTVRPTNLSSFIADRPVGWRQPGQSEDVNGDGGSEDQLEETPELRVKSFISKLMDCFWKLYSTRCTNPTISAVCSGGLVHVEATVTALVEIIHSFLLAEASPASLAADCYAELLLCQDPAVSFACRQAIEYMLRPRRKRKHVTAVAATAVAPETTVDGMNKQTEIPDKEPTVVEEQEEQNERRRHDREAAAALHRLASGRMPSSGRPRMPLPPSMAAIMDEYMAGGHPPPPEALEMMMGPFGAMAGREPRQAPPRSAVLDHMLNMAGMVDDDAMMELAIQLSLQEQESGGSEVSSQVSRQIQSSGQRRSGEQEHVEESSESSHRDKERQPQAQPREWQSTSPEYVVAGEEDSLSQSTMSCDEAHEAEVAAQQDVNGVIEAVEDVLHEHSDPFPREVLEVPEPHVDDILHEAEELYDDLAHQMEVLDMGLEDGLVLAHPHPHPDPHPHPLLDVEDQQEIPDQQIHVREQEFELSQATQELVKINEESSLPSEEATQGDQDFIFEADDELVSINSHLHQLRLSLLKLFVKHLPQLRNKGGVKSIPFLQVLLFLSSHLGNGEEDKAALDQLLERLVTDLDFQSGHVDSVAERNDSQKEVQILILRFCSILMSKSNPSESSCDVSLATCQALVHGGAVDYCLKALIHLLDYWKEHKGTEEHLVGSVSVPGALLKRHPMFPIPDMSPFFMRQYVRIHMKDIFGSYPQLLTELLLRIPYQIKKVSCNSAVPSVEFGKAWKKCLAEFMLFQQSTPVKKQVRKLLLFLCKSKEKYRQLRDLHGLAFHLKFIRDICARGGFEAASSSFVPLSLPYDTLLSLMERVRACNDIAVVRTTNWQRFCCQERGTLLYLLQISLHLPEGIAQQLLQLMACALCGGPTLPPYKSQARKEKGQAVQTSTAQTQQSTMSETQVQLCEKLVGQLIGDVSDNLLTTFVRVFMLESNSSNIRWQSHALLITLHKHSQLEQQHHLAELVWALWPQLPLYGRKATQFVDLLGHFITKSPSPVSDAKLYSARAIELLKSQNSLLHSHPNAHVYSSLQTLVEFDGYYLESDPCLVCNNPEVPYANTKLSSLKVDTRYTTTSQLVKLNGSCSMSKFLIRISDVRRAKMVRTINLYYTNRTVQSVIELKNKRSLWKHAKRCHLTPGQTEVKIDFPLPIVACNIIVEFLDFYDNFQATSETLQCPRCSAQVNANPGICGNCGENVFQCHKCRSINYDEKDPFLCISCGYCKYARFDFSLVCKPCCAVDPIETDEDRKKANSTINTLLDRADRVYKQLLAHRQPLDLLLAEVGDQGELVTKDEADASSAGGSSRSGVNKMIQALAQRYCGDCKTSFEELSKIMQKVLACRKEIVEFDRLQLEKAYTQQASRSSTPASTPTTPQSDHFGLAAPFPLGPPHVFQRKLAAGAIAKPDCYGCMTAATEHCVALLRALAAQPETRKMLIDQGLIQELVGSNLRRGCLTMRREVRALICLLTRDNAVSTRRLNRILLRHMKAAIDQNQSNPSLISSIQHEMHLLMATIYIQDSCWEDRLRCVLKLFLYSNQANSAVVMEHITLPCLKVLLHVMKLPAKITGELKEKGLPQARELDSQLSVAAERWLIGDPKYSFQSWKMSLSKAKDKARALYLHEKYGRRWLAAVKKRSEARSQLSTKAWLLRVLFTPSSKTARQVACSMVEAFCEDDTRCHQILDLLSSCLGDLGKAGQNASEFLQLYQRLSGPERWKIYLAIKGLLPKLGMLITQEIKHLTELEQTTLSSDLSQGYALKMLTELLASFIEHDQIRQRYKGKLVATILHGYLALKRLVIQRTKLVDDTQELLLELLENMTSGTEEETKAFMTICIQTLSKCPVGDVLTPTFIAERLCSIISPEDNEAADFYVILDKDPAQEEFLQGRMQGNPYSCKEPTLGPLMRDIKNKICTDCELIALLDDDTGMELLVKNKIISLDLPVKEVYKKVWCRDPGDADKPMRVLYRMRGLLGEATEDMIQSLESADGEKDDEDVYRLSSVLSQCSGLEAILERFSQVQSLIHGKQMVNALLKLLAYCVKVKANRRHLAQPQLNALNIMLNTLNQALRLERDHNDGSGAAMAEQVLLIIEAILLEASAVATAEGTVEEISTLSEDQSHLTMLLDFMDSPHVRSDASVLQAMMRLIPFLTYGDENRMQMLLDHFSPHLDFDRFDKEQGTDNKLFLDCFCNIANGIVSNAQGAQLKDLICENGIVNLAIQYVDSHLPEKPPIGVKPADDEAFKEFLARPSLPYVLRVLTGLCRQHDRTQLAVGESLIGAIHRLEQVSTEGSVGSLAENLMEALKGNPVVEKKVDEVRQQTKAEKKRLAMAMREKQLGALGMAMDEQGRVVATRQVEEEMTQLVEETGLRCCICLEGYKNQPKKALGMYTFTRRIVLDEFENKQRKTHGYTTVTHFNVVHYDCHYDAIKHSRSRDEWESASLYNGNTKCNGLLPVWGPDVSESVFAGNLARYNTNISECTGLHDTGYVFAIHDLRLLLTRFATEKSFSAETGGGGRDSNMRFIPYIISIALYVMNTTRAAANLERILTSFLDTPRDRWVSTSYELESPLYYTVVSLFVLKTEDWKKQRLTFLKRLIVLAQSRQQSPSPIDKLSTADLLEYKAYKPHILLWALVDKIHLLLKSFNLAETSSDLCSTWLDWLRHNDQTVLGACEKMLYSYQEELLPIESFQEFFDATDVLSEVGDPGDFVQSALQTVTIQ